MQSTNNKRWLIVAAIVLIGLVLITLFLTRSSKSNKTSLTGEYYDSNSKTTVSNPAGKQPESYGSDHAGVAFIGFDKLLTYGLGSGQLDLLKKGLSDFNTSLAKKYSELSLTVDSVDTVTEGNGGMNFDMLADRSKKLSVKLTYPNLDSITLTVFDGNSQLYQKDYIVNDNQGTEDDL